MEVKAGSDSSGLSPAELLHPPEVIGANITLAQIGSISYLRGIAGFVDEVMALEHGSSDHLDSFADDEEAHAMVAVVVTMSGDHQSFDDTTTLVHEGEARNEHSPTLITVVAGVRQSTPNPNLRAFISRCRNDANLRIATLLSREAATQSAAASASNVDPPSQMNQSSSSLEALQAEVARLSKEGLGKGDQNDHDGPYGYQGGEGFQGGKGYKGFGKDDDAPKEVPCLRCLIGTCEQSGDHASTNGSTIHSHEEIPLQGLDTLIADKSEACRKVGVTKDKVKGGMLKWIFLVIRELYNSLLSWIHYHRQSFKKSFPLSLIHI